ncbi:dCTP deaminase domain-containing protein [Sphingopyxis fribergensis]
MTSSSNGGGFFMVLTASELTGKAIVQGSVPAGLRPTTYDATVGSIIKCGRELNDNTVTLKPREIIWLVSTETFDLGNNTTGLATLKTTWTHQGVLALNVGIVDPGWEGPLAAAVVNLSSSDFDIQIGMPFLRLLFHKHKVIPAADLKPHKVSRQDYVRQVMGYSKAFSDTFLDMNGLSRSVADQVLGMPRWGLLLSLAAAVIGLLAISIPVGWTFMTDGNGEKAKLAVLEAKVLELEKRSAAKLSDFADCKSEVRRGKDALICIPK